MGIGQLQGYCGSSEALACIACVCLTWKSLLGLVFPAVVAVVYLPRVLGEATIDDWMLLGFATLLTYASRTPIGNGVAHMPGYLVIVVFWGINACSTERLGALRSLPLIGVFTFISALVPDIASMVTERPAGSYGIPGGNGLADGLVIKPLLGLAYITMCYLLKVHPIKPNADRRGKTYDAKSLSFLLNLSPAYRRPVHGWEGQLALIDAKSVAPEKQGAT